MPPPVTSAEFRSAMRQVVSPVAVIAAQSKKTRGGLTATAVCSATADPPTILVCVNRNSSAEPIIANSRAFSVNFLDEDQSHIARLFSAPKLDSDKRFAEGVWRRGVTGSPVLEGAVGVFDCQVVEIVPCGTHSIFLGRVLAVGSSESNPLLYRDGFFRRMAMG
jgi:flavin reductase (DIM6/NTAB) family NADH-FMN oxidoreductase RutF